MVNGRLNLLNVDDLRIRFLKVDSPDDSDVSTFFLSNSIKSTK